MNLLKQLRFRLGSAKHAHRLHQEIASLRRERDALLAKDSTPKDTPPKSLAERPGKQSGTCIEDNNRLEQEAAILGYAETGNYRRRVGPLEWYDQLAAMQVSLLFAAGLRDTHRLADVGCGSLRAGRMLIPYLRPDCYFGIEPEKWLVEEGIQNEVGRDVLEIKRPSFRFVTDFSLSGFGTTFDFVLCQSVFSHTYPELLRLGLRNIADALAPSGKLLATFREAGPGESGPRVTSNGRVLPNGWVDGGGYRYNWEELEEFLQESGLIGKKLNWPHQSQSWFVACQVGSEAETAIDSLSRQLRPPRPKWGTRRQGPGRRTIHWE